ncbi:MAG: hypothetical protein U0263_39140 [Polyangiaceae bacterium]
MAVFTGGALGALVKLRCPHCHELQVRARKPSGSRYACRKCHKRFDREAGEEAARRR